MLKRLLLADDHGLMLEGLTRLLAGEFEIVGTVVDGRSLVVEAERLRPDVVVLDIGMPELNGIEAARQLNKSLPVSKIVFVTQQLEGDRDRLVALHDLGFHHLGLPYHLTGPQAASRRDTGRKLGLSDEISREFRFGPARQREVLQLVAEGKTMKEISAVLHISPKTVEFHRNSLMNELGVRTTAELTRYAVSRGIVS